MNDDKLPRCVRCSTIADFGAVEAIRVLAAGLPDENEYRMILKLIETVVTEIKQQAKTN